MTCERTICIIFLFLISLPGHVLAQDTSDLTGARQFFMEDVQRPDYLMAHQNTNEVQLLFSGLFLFYKSFVSSQDAGSCTFSPSCSEFGILAVKAHGPFIGVLSTFDRLTRCHGLSPSGYEKDLRFGLLIDHP